MFLGWVIENGQLFSWKKGGWLKMGYFFLERKGGWVDFVRLFSWTIIVYKITFLDTPCVKLRFWNLIFFLYINRDEKAMITTFFIKKHLNYDYDDFLIKNFKKYSWSILLNLGRKTSLLNLAKHWSCLILQVLER